MPCLDISTNVNLEGINTDSIFSELTKAVSQIIGKPEKVSSLSIQSLCSVSTVGLVLYKYGLGHVMVLVMKIYLDYTCNMSLYTVVRVYCSNPKSCFC